MRPHELKARNPRAAVATVVAEGFFGRLAFGMVSFAFPLYAVSLGLSLAEIGLLVSLRSLVVLPFKPVSGWLADRFGIRPVYMAALLARVLAALGLLLGGGVVGLALVRVLQGVSAAGRDVASLGVIARDAESSVGTTYSWYASAKHLGGVAGAGVAGGLIAMSGGRFAPLFGLVLALSVLPVIAAWLSLAEAPAEDEPESENTETNEAAEATGGPGRLEALVALARELAGPASVGMLVAASAYMVHGIFPVLATEYAGLSEAEAGLIYTLSAVVFLAAGPAFGWLTDHHGRLAVMGARSAANIGSSLLYLLSPTFGGIAAARAVDDAGKAAFRPAWASSVAEIASADPRNNGRRLGVLDTAETAGEVIGPALAGVLWQSGGVVALFIVRIAIAVVAELAAVRVFGELSGRRPHPSPRLTALAYLTPPLVAFAIIVGWLGMASEWGTASSRVADLVLCTVVMLAGFLAGALAGRFAFAAERRVTDMAQEEALSDLRHDVRGSLSVIRGEVELVLSQGDVPDDARRTSGASVIEEVERVEEILLRRPPERTNQLSVQSETTGTVDGT